MEPNEDYSEMVKKLTKYYDYTSLVTETDISNSVDMFQAALDNFRKARKTTFVADSEYRIPLKPEQKKLLLFVLEPTGGNLFSLTKKDRIKEIVKNNYYHDSDREFLNKIRKTWGYHITK